MFIDQRNKQQTIDAAGRFGLDEEDDDDTDLMNGNIMAGGAGITPPTDLYNNPGNYVRSMMQQSQEAPTSNFPPKVMINLEDAVLQEQKLN